MRHLADRHARKGHGAPFYALVFITAVLVLNALFGDHGAIAMRRAQREYEQAQAEVAKAREENGQLLEQKRRLKSDEATIEDLARRDLGLIKRGEVIFFIKDVPPTGRK
ncbi:MAG: FtsB family cell division protein [Bacteroidales bacterium]